ncbi:hypothetical protein [Hoeflea sp. TYP-13]|uniref:hypothetical protein n=1 Tax=Hoeflea sp. TYP-13 TaxID=3230023 RepID=UPI0034C60084
MSAPVHQHDWHAIAISSVLLAAIMTIGFFAVLGLVDGWPRLEVLLYGAKPV